MDYHYPGNVRELKAIVQAAVNLAQNEPISVKHLSIDSNLKKRTAEPIVPLQQIEKKYILKVYNELGENKSQTARALGIALNTLRTRLESYGVT